MAASINASTTAGVVTTADTSGVLQLQTAGTTAISIDASQAVTFTNSANLPNTFGFKNRIINGAMVIDQRNAGASVTIPATANTYTLDRWYGYGEQASKFSVQQSSTVPTGFINSSVITSLSAYSVLSTDTFQFAQKIEGFNVFDLGWGAAGAQAVTISFWVRSSLIGTFGGSITNSALSRSYPFSYTISAANTWEQKSVTIAGDTSGTWLKDNGTGLRLHFGLGAGSTYSGTAGSWASAWYSTCTGATSVVGTNGATFYITGVQLEKGSTATAFDYRDYGRELIMCQRYYEVIPMTGMTGTAGGGTLIAFSRPYSVQKRATPTVAIRSGTSANFNAFRPLVEATNSGPVVSTSIGDAATFTVELDGYSGLTNNNSWSGRYSAGTFSASAEL